jgi:TetR/AcrR family transcriptional regulator, copper-responsive repressor
MGSLTRAQAAVAMSVVKQNVESGKRPRGRPRAYEPDAALRSAALAFWKNGYAGTSLEDIAAATGMNRPSLHAAFGDKREIYLKALHDYWQRKLAVVHRAFEHDGTLAQMLMRVYDAVLSLYFSGDDRVLGCFMLGTAITEAPGDDEIRRILEQSFDTLDADFEARFKQAHAAGELKAEADPKALALLASATMHTMALRARAGSSRHALKQLARKATRAICG